MTGDWSREVQREYVGGDVRFELPVRQLGWGRLVGVFLLGFSGLFILGPAKGIIHSLGRLDSTQQAGFEYFGLVFGLAFVIGGCMPAGLGLLILFGRCRVEWKEGRLQSAERLGPLRWTRRLPQKPIRKLEVAAATSTSGVSAPREIQSFSGLMVKYADGSKAMVAFGYPKDWMLALAQELKTYMGNDATAEGSLPVEVAERSPGDEADADDQDLCPPPGCRVQLEERGGGIRMMVPPAGIWKGAGGLFFFALLWCGFMGVFTTLACRAGTKLEGPVVVFILFIGAFWLIGFGLLAGAINLARRTAKLSVDMGRLQVETEGLFGRKVYTWSGGEIAAICAGPSGVKVNHRPVFEIQIHLVRGKKVGFLIGRGEPELRWMAAQLRRALQVPARPAGTVANKKF